MSLIDENMAEQATLDGFEGLGYGRAVRCAICTTAASMEPAP